MAKSLHDHAKLGVVMKNLKCNRRGFSPYCMWLQQTRKKDMIRHTVMFTLKHETGSEEEKAFLDEALSLTSIETVKKFERLRQCSQKCDHHFGFSMEFDSQADYQIYNDHPVHTKFVNERWIPEVKSFQEIDYVLYEQ